MRLKSLSLENFRCFKKETIEFEPYTGLVGANNAGKSAILAALDIFFKSNPKNIPITSHDFYKWPNSKELIISVTFTDLKEDELKEFTHYARAGEVTFFIKAIANGELISSSIHGTRSVNPAFIEFFEKDNAADKKEFYKTLTSKFGLPDWQSQTAATEALQKYENEHPKENVPTPSKASAFGVEGPISKLKQFIEFVYIPAVKDADAETIEARNTAFSKLIERAVRAKLKIEERLEKIRQSTRTEIGLIAQDHQQILKDLEERIGGEYAKFNTSESKLHLNWGNFDEKNLQINLPVVQLEISDDMIKNAKIKNFGHGTQRNYLMALLLVSASYDLTNLQTLILACEEPELYQHPPQARMLADAFYNLASKQTQVIITTHSTYFIKAKSFENIRVIRRTEAEESKVFSWTIEKNCDLISKAKNQPPIGDLAARAAINQFLQPQMSEMFFSPYIVFVEGEEDRSILSKYSLLSKTHSDLFIKGVHIVQINGKGNMINAIAIATGFDIPFFAIFDCDMSTLSKLDKAKQLAGIELNRQILAMLKYDGPHKNGAPDQHLMSSNFFAWKDDLQTALSEDISEWHNQKIKICEEFGWTLDRLQKNPMVLEATLERLYKDTPIPSLELLCATISKRFNPPLTATKLAA